MPLPPSLRLFRGVSTRQSPGGVYRATCDCFTSFLPGLAVGHLRRATGGGPNFPLLTEGKVSKFSTSGPRGEIDTLGFSFECSSHWDLTGARVTILDFGTERQRESYNRPLEGGGFLGFGMGGRAWVEASLPKRMDGSNVEAVGVSDALEIAREAYRESQKFVEPVASGKHFELSKIVRVDPVRDFDGVHHVPELLNGLAAVPRPVVQKVRRFADAERNRAESLRVGPKAWASQLYDKCAETNGEASPGRLRYEGRFHAAQLESQWARKSGVCMRLLCDLTEEKVRALTMASFERVGFGREVVGKASVAEAVFGDNGLSPRVQASLWAYLTAPGMAGRMHRETSAKYRRLAEGLGVTMAAAQEEAADVVVRLDFETGTEVLRVA